LQHVLGNSNEYITWRARWSKCQAEMIGRSERSLMWITFTGHGVVGVMIVKYWTGREDTCTLLQHCFSYNKWKCLAKFFCASSFLEDAVRTCTIRRYARSVSRNCVHYIEHCMYICSDFQNLRFAAQYIYVVYKPIGLCNGDALFTERQVVYS
jgi:hypothetical protein